MTAAFLQHSQRDLFSALARELGVAFFILRMRAAPGTLQERIISRSRQGPDPTGPDPSGPDPSGPDPSGPDPSDAGLDTLAHQLATQEPLAGPELHHVIDLDETWRVHEAALQRTLAPLSAALGTSHRP